MTDVVDRATCSRMMAGTGSRNTQPELVLRRTLHARGLRYRLHDRKLPGTPDLVFRRFGVVCFVHGCFWHRHAGRPYATTPATREQFWKSKFDANVERDRRNRYDLLRAGWRIAIVRDAYCASRAMPDRATSGSVAARERTGIRREFRHGLGGYRLTLTAPGRHNRWRYPSIAHRA